MFVIDENLYYYFPLIGIPEGRAIYSSWEEGEMPDYPNEGKYSDMKSWNDFLDRQHSANIKTFTIMEFPEQCEFVQRTVIKKLFTGWLL